jgi:hypothetical protein
MIHCIDSSFWCNLHKHVTGRDNGEEEQKEYKEATFLVVCSNLLRHQNANIRLSCLHTSYFHYQRKRCYPLS